MDYVLCGRYSVALIDYGCETKIAIIGDRDKIFRTVNNNALDFLALLVDNNCSKIEKVDGLIKVTFEVDDSKVVEEDD